jgi:quercetin dioxygenase-like cupin family protein
MNPYKDIDTTTNKTVRIFTQDVDSHELVWHRDREDRIVRVLEGSGWKFQLDNNLPIQLNEGDVIHIPKYEYHRIIKGDTDLKVELYK